MFYANFILAKKGPLAKIWLAAHYEKKLNRSQILETDIQSSVNDIISPKIPIALRTSGHLLLGVVRIYSKKTKILFDDANESFIKLKHLTHSDTLDLPKEKLVVDVDSITLPELPENRLFLNLSYNSFYHDIGTDAWQVKETLRATNLEPSFDFFSRTPKEIMRGHESNSIIDTDAKFSKSNIDSLVVSKDKITINPNTDNFKKNFDNVVSIDYEMFMDGDGIVPGIEDLINDVENIQHNVASFDNKNDFLENELKVILKPFEFKKELNKLKKKKQLKLLVDDEKSIKSEIFKRSLNDISDIIIKKMRFNSDVEYNFTSCYYVIQDFHNSLVSDVFTTNIEQAEVTLKNDLRNFEEDYIRVDSCMIDKQFFNDNSMLDDSNKSELNVNDMKNDLKKKENYTSSSNSFEKFISKHWSKTTVDVFNEISIQSRNESKLFLNKLVNIECLKKYTTAAIFYSLLVLHKENLCKLYQSTSFSEVYLLFN